MSEPVFRRPFKKEQTFGEKFGEWLDIFLTANTLTLTTLLLLGGIFSKNIPAIIIALTSYGVYLIAKKIREKHYSLSSLMLVVLHSSWLGVLLVLLTK